MIDRIPELDVLAGPVVGEEAALAEVRARVLSQVRRRPQWPVWLAAAAMVAVALLAGWLARRLNAPVETMTYALHAPAAPEVKFSLPPAPVRKVVQRRVKPPAKPSEPIVVRFETDDPNVVILWLGD